MRRNTSFVLLAGLLVNTAPLAAQEWDAPTFFSPRPGEDIGVYVIVPEGADDVGFAGIWRMEGNLNLGVRLGYVPDYFHIGAEFYRPLDLFGPQSPLLLSWNLGLGASFNHFTWLRVPLGASLGLELGQPGGIRIMPYVHPRVALDLLVEDVAGREETSTEFNFAVDLGADAALGQSFVLRVGYKFADWNTFGAGIAYRLPRRIAVR